MLATFVCIFVFCISFRVKAVVKKTKQQQNHMGPLNSNRCLEKYYLNTIFFRKTSYTNIFEEPAFEGRGRDDYKSPNPRGYSGINVTEGWGGGGGVRRSIIFCTQKNTWTLCCAPKKIQDWKSYFWILRELWLELRKNY